VPAFDLNIPSVVVEVPNLPPDEIEAPLHRPLAVLLFSVGSCRVWRCGADAHDLANRLHMAWAH